MHSITLLLASLVVGFAAAQNSSTVNLSGVDLTTKNQWCISEKNNCPLLCGGPANVKANECVGNNLPSYTCTCNNNTAPAMIANYTDTIPYYICQYQFSQCRTATPGSTACAECGKWPPSSAPKIDAATASSSASSSSAAPSSASSSAAPAATSTKAAAPKLGPEHAVGGAAMGVLAAMGMFL